MPDIVEALVQQWRAAPRYRAASDARNATTPPARATEPHPFEADEETVTPRMAGLIARSAWAPTLIACRFMLVS
jgi:hypothetical protein